MAIQDPIADLLTRIRNSGLSKAKELEVPYSKIKYEICKILLEEGYLLELNVFTKDLVKKFISIKLKYCDDEFLIGRIKNISKVSCRVYKSKSSIPKVLNGFGICIMSTSKGIMTGRNARKANIGGELLAEVW
tara:strand:+ start:507 stop:905 length:399 start_codon:yes stop_codon:yes gene_type:complete